MARIDTIDRETDLTFLCFFAAGDVEGITKVQKLLFLIEEESELAEEYEDLSFEFKGYDYGPFSEQVYDEVELLVNMGALEVVEPEYDVSEIGGGPENEYAGKKFQLTEKGEKISRQISGILEEDVENDLNEMMGEYNSMSLNELLEYVYTQYPEYTKKSKIKEDILE